MTPGERLKDIENLWSKNDGQPLSTENSVWLIAYVKKQDAMITIAEGALERIQNRQTGEFLVGPENIARKALSKIAELRGNG